MKLWLDAVGWMRSELWDGCLAQHSTEAGAEEAIFALHTVP